MGVLRCLTRMRADWRERRLRSALKGISWRLTSCACQLGPLNLCAGRFPMGVALSEPSDCLRRAQEVSLPDRRDIFGRRFAPFGGAPISVLELGTKVVHGLRVMPKKPTPPSAVRMVRSVHGLYPTPENVSSRGFIEGRGKPQPPLPREAATAAGRRSARYRKPPGLSAQHGNRCERGGRKDKTQQPPTFDEASPKFESHQHGSKVVSPGLEPRTPGRSSLPKGREARRALSQRKAG